MTDIETNSCCRDNKIKRLSLQDEKAIIKHDTLGGKQDMLCVNESGLYALIFKSRKPQAKRFKKWVTSVVLPEIRKTGGYNKPQTEIDLIDRMFAPMKNLGIKPELVEAAKLDAIARTYPKLKEAAETAKSLLSASSAIPDRPMTPRELGVAIAQKLSLDYTPSANKVNKALLTAGLQEIYYRTNSKKETVRDGYRLTEAGKKYGQMQQTTARNSQGVVFKVVWFSSVIDAIGSSVR